MLSARESQRREQPAKDNVQLRVPSVYPVQGRRLNFSCTEYKEKVKSGIGGKVVSVGWPGAES